MFLHVLNDPEKLAFWGLAQEFVKADGVVRPAEKQALARMAREMKLPLRAKPPAQSRGERCAVFTSHRARVAALLEMLSLANADENFAEAEREFIQSLASAFGIPEAELKALADWIDRYDGLLRQAAGFLAEPAPPPLPR